MKVIKSSLVVICSAFCLVAESANTSALEKEFVSPPDSARPHTWWHWMNGNVTKEGITADLEAMKNAGVGGAQIFNAAEGIPHGPIQFNSDEWIGMVKYAAKEAKRLGLELCIHNCAGWSSSGGPWNTPENSMKVVVTSECQVNGPKKFDALLEQPKTNMDFYRDVAVVAFRTPVGESLSMNDAKPVVSISAKGGEAGNLTDGKASSVVQFPKPGPSTPGSIQFDFPEAYKARTLTLTPGPGMQGCKGYVEISDDGKSFQKLTSFSMGKGHEPLVIAFNPVSAKVYRILFTSMSSRMRRLVIADAELSRKVAIDNLAGKLFLDRTVSGAPSLATEFDNDEVVAGDRMVMLTDRMSAAGKLSWDVPAGEWTILRMGYTTNGRKNHPAPVEGTGLECDKLSKEAAQAHWNGHMGRILAELGDLAGNADSGLNNVLIDSYEVGTQNWTKDFEKIFRQRCGYDLLRFMPVFSGRVVDSPEVTERFLWDFRRTIADLFAENYSGAFAEMAHKAGLQYSVEPYGNCPSDDLQYGSYCDIPMSEFWPGGGSNPGNAKFAASVAHVYGKRIVGAESFTAAPEAGKWQQDPYSIKAQGDAVYCAGVNRIIYHRYAHQPWVNPARYPGMTMGQWGTHFERTVTWWNQASAWLTYQARCQYLLQKGQFVADVCFYCGEDAPNGLRGGGLPPGFDYDGCETSALKHMSVKDGCIVLPSGMRYRMLVLPGDKRMSPDVIRNLQKLVAAGATVIGPKPEKAPGLAGFPASDAEVEQLADSLWNDRGIRDISSADAIKAMGLQPDFLCEDEGARLAFIHRRIDDAEVYFVASHKNAVDNLDCSFRVSGLLPELWHPESGVIEQAPVYKEENGRTTVALRFEPSGSVFVVFRKPVSGDHAVAVSCAVEPPDETAPVYELKVLKAEYGAYPDLALVDSVDVTKKIKSIVSGGMLKLRAHNGLEGDPAPNVFKQMKVTYLLDGKKGELIIDENKTGQLPEGALVVRAVYGLITDDEPEQKPQIVDVTDKVAGLVKNGQVSVKADNALVDGKDPAFMTVKELRVTYVYRGVTREAQVRENQMLILPEDSKRNTPPPDYTLDVDRKGKLALSVWTPGKYEIETASGKVMKNTFSDLRKPVELTGSWELNFPPGWGAPDHVNLDELISWTEHKDNGVKYFSGTATYVKEFAWDSRILKDERLVLDLGDLKNIAQVELNGKSLGILWKPPFRVDVTENLRKGKNELKVKVTNLWPNRLIGDEFLPEDREWEGIRLKEWPQWLLDGKPSPTGRYTFTTWHHWTKDDAPLLSGLFGPVKLRTVKVVPLMDVGK